MDDDRTILATRPEEGGLLDSSDDGLRVELARLEQLQAEAQELFYRLASAISPVLRPEDAALATGRLATPEREGRQRAELSTVVVEAQHRQHSLIDGLRDVLDRVNL